MAARVWKESGRCRTTTRATEILTLSSYWRLAEVCLRDILERACMLVGGKHHQKELNISFMRTTYCASSVLNLTHYMNSADAQARGADG
jgi:hypothetical protein